MFLYDEVYEPDPGTFRNATVRGRLGRRQPQPDLLRSTCLSTAHSMYCLLLHFYVHALLSYLYVYVYKQCRLLYRATQNTFSTTLICLVIHWMFISVCKSKTVIYLIYHAMHACINFIYLIRNRSAMNIALTNH